MTCSADSPALRKIRALLDKAASSEFPAESDALIAKAFDLMARHHIDEALVEASREAADPSQIIEVHSDLGAGPYVRARLALLVAVSGPLDVQVLTSVGRDGRRSHLIGHRSDVNRAQWLYTTLLAQATSGMLSRRPPAGVKTVTWRRSFLFGFAHRVDERLAEAKQDAIDSHTTDGSAAGEAPDGPDGPVRSAALVLADRSERVQDFLKARYPRVGKLRQTRSKSSQAGWVAGRDAGDDADLSGDRTVPEPKKRLGA